MRKWIFGLCLLGVWTGVYGAAPWGAMRGYDEKLENSQRNAAFAGGYRFLLPQIITGDSVRVSLHIPAEDEKKRANYEQMIAQNYNKWFEQTAKIIRSSGREREFADVLKILDRGIKVVFLPPQAQVDVRFYIVPFSSVRQRCGEGAGGCYIPMKKEGDVPAIYLPKDQFLLKTLSLGRATTRFIGLHEIGHSLGLSDQYKKARNSTTHRRYASAETGKSIMNHSTSITCDDADGIVNLIDIAQGTARGGDKGWKSLCPKSKDYYIRGQSGLRGPYTISSDDMQEWELETYQNGTRAEVQRFLLAENSVSTVFEPLPESVRQRDGLKRPVLAVGPRGEKIYYAYFYDTWVKLAVLGGKAVRGEIFQPETVSSNRQKITHRSVYAKKGDRVVVLVASYNTKGGKASYVEISNAKEALLEMTLYFDKKGQVISAFYSEPNPRLDMLKKKAPQEVYGVLAHSSLLNEVADKTKQAQKNHLQQQLAQWFNWQKHQPQ